MSFSVGFFSFLFFLSFVLFWNKISYDVIVFFCLILDTLLNFLGT